MAQDMGCLFLFLTVKHYLCMFMILSLELCTRMSQAFLHELCWGRFINDRIASFATLKSLIARVAATAVSSNCDRYFRFANIANRYLEAVLAFHQKSQIAKAPAIIAINRKNL